MVIDSILGFSLHTEHQQVDGNREKLQEMTSGADCLHPLADSIIRQPKMKLP